MKMKLILLIFLQFILGYNTAISQKWVNNNLSDYLKNKYVVDIEKSDDELFVLTSNSFIKYSFNSLTEYYINSNNYGSLDDFIFTRKHDSVLLANNFFKILIDHKTIYLIDIHGNIKEIINNNMYNYSLKEISSYLIKNVFIDDSKIYMLMNNASETKQALTVFSKGKYTYTEQDRVFENIFNYNKKKYYIKRAKLDSLYGYAIYNFENEFICNISESNEDLRFNFFENQNQFFILSSNGELYKFKDELIVLINKYANFDRKTLNTNNQISKSLNINSFIYFNNYLYIPTTIGLVRYDFINHLILKPSDFKEHCTFGFTKTSFIDNKIYCIYGQGIKSNCIRKKYGISIYSVE